MYIAEPHNEILSAVNLDFSLLAYCVAYFDVDLLEGNFLGLMTDAAPCAETFCGDTSCTEWSQMGVKQQDVVNVLGCPECDGCLQDTVDYCDFECTDGLTCLDYIEKGQASYAVKACEECSLCDALDASQTTTTSGVGDCSWWNCAS